ncbi:tyrosine-protein phosphatase non-receptor type 12-like, partial [Saccoglossus kowalevskii]|uniref:protein-tyrosine-phosphatase n=1 Tax=Saccoglossus kowalevskii TaxID=10224 RepID=A0ABM0MWB7_SACKO
DETRVKLDNQGPDYINANFVTGVDDAAKVYIASQAPLPNTVVDFWRMMWHYKVEIIVMACKTVENGKAKCEKYWPELDDEKVFGLFTITLASEKRLSQNVVVREICARKGDEQRKFTQFHYQAWPDHGIPSSSLPIINMIKAFRKLQPHDNIPIVIHCSAGCGRTGAIIVLDLVMKLLEMEKIEETFDLFNLIDNMRRQRPAIVQTRDQYEFVHLAVSELMIEEIKSKHQNLTGHTYENIQCENP